MLAPGELARLLHVNPKTGTRWCRDGKIDAIVTPGGHRRFPIASVLAFMHEMGFEEDAAVEAVIAVDSPTRS